MLKSNGHDAMLEFGQIIIKFITNRGVSHELVRHRLFSFAQESTRYVRYHSEDIEMIEPVWLSDVTDANHAYFLWQQACLETIAYYLRLIGTGWSAQQAREVLPNSLKTEIIVSGNPREWRHCLKLRTSDKAHPQMRALMAPVLEELKIKLPVLFDDI